MCSTAKGSTPGGNGSPPSRRASHCRPSMLSSGCRTTWSAMGGNSPHTRTSNNIWRPPGRNSDGTQPRKISMRTLPRDGASKCCGGPPDPPGGGPQAPPGASLQSARPGSGALHLRPIDDFLEPLKPFSCEALEAPRGVGGEPRPEAGGRSAAPPPGGLPPAAAPHPPMCVGTPDLCHSPSAAGRPPDEVWPRPDGRPEAVGPSAPPADPGFAEFGRSRSELPQLRPPAPLRPNKGGGISTGCGPNFASFPPERGRSECQKVSSDGARFSRRPTRACSHKSYLRSSRCFPQGGQNARTWPSFGRQSYESSHQSKAVPYLLCLLPCDLPPEAICTPPLAQNNDDNKMSISGKRKNKECARECVFPQGHQKARTWPNFGRQS